MASLSSSEQVDPDIHVGTPTILSFNRSRNIHFHDFRSLPSKKNKTTLSPEFECHGYKWQLKLYPGGETYEYSTQEHTGLFLCSLNDKVVKAKYSFHIIKNNFSKTCEFPNVFTKGKTWGWSDFRKRKDIITSSLNENGSLTIRVDIQVCADKVQGWKPQKTLASDMSELFKSGDGADVKFSVDEEIIRAHNLILKMRAPLLAEIVDSSPSGTDANVRLPDVKANVLRFILEFLYTDECPKNISKEDATLILVAANKFGCQRLKLLVETVLVEQHLDGSTAIDFLLLADGSSCALLKESSMRLIVENLSTTMKSPGWTKVKESSDLLNEIMSDVAGLKSEETNDSYSKLTVREILCKLEEKNLDVDGTRQMLLKRLRENSDEKEKENDKTQNPTAATN